MGKGAATYREAPHVAIKSDNPQKTPEGTWASLSNNKIPQCTKFIVVFVNWRTV